MRRTETVVATGALYLYHSSVRRLFSFKKKMLNTEKRKPIDRAPVSPMKILAGYQL